MRQEIHEATRPIERSSLGAAALPPTRARVWGRQAGNQCDASLQLFASLQLLRKSVIWNDHLIIRVEVHLVGAFFIEREMRERRAKLALRNASQRHAARRYLPWQGRRSANAFSCAMRSCTGSDDKRTK